MLKSYLQYWERVDHDIASGWSAIMEGPQEILSILDNGESIERIEKLEFRRCSFASTKVVIKLLKSTTTLTVGMCFVS